jgi:hypothetical protein
MTKMNKQNKKTQNNASKQQSGTNNNNPPDRNGGDLPCGWRQLLNADSSAPNPPWSTFLTLWKWSENKSEGM